MIASPRIDHFIYSRKTGMIWWCFCRLIVGKYWRIKRGGCKLKWFKRVKKKKKRGKNYCKSSSALVKRSLSCTERDWVVDFFSLKLDKFNLLFCPILGNFETSCVLERRGGKEEIIAKIGRIFGLYCFCRESATFFFFFQLSKRHSILTSIILFHLFS